MLSEEDKELEKKYFGLALELGEYGSHNLANYEHTFTSFYDCEECGCTVHSDKTVDHAKWHENQVQGLKEVMEYLNFIGATLKKGK